MQSLLTSHHDGRLGSRLYTTSNYLLPTAAVDRDLPDLCFGRYVLHIYLGPKNGEPLRNFRRDNCQVRDNQNDHVPVPGMQHLLLFYREP